MYAELDFFVHLMPVLHLNKCTYRQTLFNILVIILVF